MQSQAETVRLLAQALQGTYGDQLKMRYIDVIDDDLDEYPEVEAYLKKTGMKLPLLKINDKIIRPAAGLNYMEIAEELEEMGFNKSL